MDQWDDALGQYDKAISLDKYEGKFYYNRAQVKAKLDRYEEAIRDFEKAIQNPSEPTLYYARYNKGICLRKVGKVAESIEELKRAVELKPDNASAHNNLGLSYFEEGQFEEAISEYGLAISYTRVEDERDVKKRKEAALHFNNRGLAFYRTKKLGAALEDLNQAIEFNPDEPIYYFN